MLFRLRYQLVIVFLVLAWLAWQVPNWSFFSDRTWLGKEFMLRDGAELWQDGRLVPENQVPLPFKVTECSFYWLKFDQAWVRKRDVLPFDEAPAYFKAFLQEHPQSGWAHTGLGIVWEHEGNLQKAIEEYTESIAIRPDSIAPRLNRAALYGMQGEYEKATQDLKKVLEIDAEYAEAYRLRGRVYEDEHKYVNAFLDYQAALKIEPDNPYMSNALAWLMATCPDRELRDGQEAVTLARKSCELTKWNYTFPIDTLAAAYAESGDFELAVKYQEQALALPGTESEQRGMEQRLELYRHHKPYHQSQLLPAEQARG